RGPREAGSVALSTEPARPFEGGGRRGVLELMTCPPRSSIISLRLKSRARATLPLGSPSPAASGVQFTWAECQPCRERMFMMARLHEIEVRQGRRPKPQFLAHLSRIDPRAASSCRR